MNLKQQFIDRFAFEYSESVNVVEAIVLEEIIDSIEETEDESEFEKFITFIYEKLTKRVATIENCISNLEKNSLNFDSKSTELISIYSHLILP